MAYTSHGHHIPGTVKGTGTVGDVARCGGTNGCPRCRSEMQNTFAIMHGESTDFHAKAKMIVRDYIDRMHGVSGMPPQAYELYLPWFSKTLYNWKATVGTTLPDDMYYEVTHSGEKRETYLDAYRKVDNVVIPD